MRRQPLPPIQTCWCCGVSARGLRDDIYWPPNALCGPCLRTSPSTADTEARARAAIAAFLVADDGSLAPFHRGRPAALRGLLPAGGVGLPMARGWVALAAREARVLAWVDAGTVLGDSRFEYVSEGQVDVIERVIATEAGEHARRSVPPPFVSAAERERRRDQEAAAAKRGRRGAGRLV